MKPYHFLRIASLLTLIHAALHTIGGVFGKPDPGPAALAVSAMIADQFTVFGLQRSYWDFYMGLGLAVTILLTAEAVVFWTLGSLAKKDGMALRPTLMVFFFGYLGLAVNSYFNFFFGPVIVEVLIAMCLGFAILKAEPSYLSQRIEE
jgi:hypothetical protein